MAKASEPFHPIWNPHTMFCHPAPKKIHGTTTAIDSHGPTPRRRRSVRMRTAQTRCRSTVAARYGT